MTKIEQPRKNLASDSAGKSKGSNIEFKKAADKMEKKLECMGIQLERTGPRIQAPAHTRSGNY